MAVNARTEKFQHIEVFDKPALFTNGRIARDTVPKGWYCYDIRGSDDDPGELCYMEENVVVNHAGSVLMPEKLSMPKSGRLDVRDELGFLDEGNMTLREFCEAHQLPYPAENMKFHIRPARPEEAGLFYTPHPEEDKRLGMEKLGAVVMLAEPKSAAQIKNLAESLDLFDLAPGAHTPQEYGKYMIQQSGHFEYDENLDAFYDYEKYGTERMNAEDGMFTDRGYIAYKGYTGMEEMMNGGQSNHMVLGGLSQ